MNQVQASVQPGATGSELPVSNPRPQSTSIPPDNLDWNGMRPVVWMPMSTPISSVPARKKIKSAVHTDQYEGETWREFFRRRHHRHLEIEKNESTIARQSRLSKMKAAVNCPYPGSRGPRVFRWLEDDNGFRVRTYTPKGTLDGWWDDYSYKRMIYNPFENEWDVCSEFDPDFVPNKFTAEYREEDRTAQADLDYLLRSPRLESSEGNGEPSEHRKSPGPQPPSVSLAPQLIPALPQTLSVSQRDDEPEGYVRTESQPPPTSLVVPSMPAPPTQSPVVPSMSIAVSPPPPTIASSLPGSPTQSSVVPSMSIVVSPPLQTIDSSLPGMSSAATMTVDTVDGWPLMPDPQYFYRYWYGLSLQANLGSPPSNIQLWNWEKCVLALGETTDRVDSWGSDQR